jgi:hypothetical protein
MTICTCWILKSLEFIFFTMFVVEKNSWPHSAQNFGQKKSEKLPFLRLVKIVIVQKSH